jgi:very-short-patch-repair endonuclease
MSPPLCHVGYGTRPVRARMGHRARRVGFARKLRRDATEVELLLWQELRGRRLEGYRFRRQHPIGPYVLDFYCPTVRLCVEVDGSGHLDRREDDRRTAWLTTRGVRVIRFWDHEVSNNREQVLQAVVDAIEDRQHTRGPPPPVASRPPPPPAAGEE